MKRKLPLLGGLAVVALLAGACASLGPRRPPLATVPSVDLQRYAGKWFEIAAYPHFFQRGCTGSTAEYAALPDGRISVTNRCVKNGESVTVRGVARVVPGSGNARLKVRIGPAPFAGDYWVIALDSRDYQWAVVGHPSRNYLWILARRPTLDPALYQRLLREIERLGYDPARIVKTPPAPPAT